MLAAAGMQWAILNIRPGMGSGCRRRAGAPSQRCADSRRLSTTRCVVREHRNQETEEELVWVGEATGFSLSCDTGGVSKTPAKCQASSQSFRKGQAGLEATHTKVVTNAQGE